MTQPSLRPRGPVSCISGESIGSDRAPAESTVHPTGIRAAKEWEQRSTTTPRTGSNGSKRNAGSFACLDLEVKRGKLLVASITMPKAPPPTGRSKVRFFFVEADLAPGDMQQLTNALSNAIRQPTQARRVDLLPAESTSAKADVELEMEEQPEVELEADGAQQQDVEARTPRGPRKYRSPKVVNDLNMDAGGMPFEKYAAQVGALTDHSMRYLVAAAWLKEYAKVSPVNADHIYTCYKSAGWTFDTQDPAFPFRYLKRQAFGDTSKGNFTLNHLGEAKVKKMMAEQA